MSICCRISTGLLLNWRWSFWSYNITGCKKIHWCWRDFCKNAQSYWLSLPCSERKLLALSLKSGRFPVDWKFARIVPIAKSDPTNPANYRPIFILSILSNLFENHVHAPTFVTSLGKQQSAFSFSIGIYREKSLPPLLCFLLFTTVIWPWNLVMMSALCFTISAKHLIVFTTIILLITFFSRG